jgi:hypothetical protein
VLSLPIVSNAKYQMELQALLTETLARNLCEDGYLKNVGLLLRTLIFSLQN